MFNSQADRINGVRLYLTIFIRGRNPLEIFLRRFQDNLENRLYFLIDQTLSQKYIISLMQII